MRFSKMAGVVALVALFALTLSAADVTGKYKTVTTTPQGTREGTLTLKADGEKLTGSVSGRAGDTEIAEGKVSGDDVSFVVVRNFGGNEMKMKYTGKLAGKEIKFQVDAGQFQFEMTATKE